MAHQIAKLLLEKADTFLSRQEAILSAMEMGMPLNEIQEYLDWLDMLRSGVGRASSHAETCGDERQIECPDLEAAPREPPG